MRALIALVVSLALATAAEASAIGPTFPLELRAAGLPTNDLSWSPVTGAITFGPSWTPTMQAQAEAVLAAHNPNKLTPAQTFGGAIAAGLAVTSSSTPAINAIYALDPQSQANLVAIASSIAAGEGLPGGASTVQWADINGVLHTLSQSQFLALAKAVRDYVYAIDIDLEQASAGQAVTWPAATAAIP